MPYHSKGFTLLELLVSLAILALLAHMALPVAEVTIQRMHEQDLRSALREIRNAIDAYKRAADDGRIEVSVGKSGYPPSLQILVDGVANQKDPKHSKIYFLRRLPRDPLEINQDIKNEDTWGKRSYASDADNPEEGEDVFDIFSNSEKIGLNGIPYRQW